VIQYIEPDDISKTSAKASKGSYKTPGTFYTEIRNNLGILTSKLYALDVKHLRQEEIKKKISTKK